MHIFWKKLEKTLDERNADLLCSGHTPQLGQKTVGSTSMACSEMVSSISIGFIGSWGCNFPTPPP